MHRLRRLRRGLSECFGHAFHFREGFASGVAAAGSPERDSRVLKMVRQMDAEGFGNCTNTYECEAVCPAEISACFISKLNREYARASFKNRLG